MTVDEERLLASSENYKHSFGSVQTGKLELMINMFNRYNLIVPELKAQVGEFSLFVFCLLVLIVVRVFLIRPISN